MANDAITLAKYIIAKRKAKNREIKNEELQLLLYTAQRINLNLTHEPLFDDKIEAWTFGPCVPNVYCFYDSLVKEAIDTDYCLSVDTLNILNKLVRMKGYEPILQINKRTGAWTRVFKQGNGISNEIPISYIESYG